MKSCVERDQLGSRLNYGSQAEKMITESRNFSKVGLSVESVNPAVMRVSVVWW